MRVPGPGKGKIDDRRRPPKVLSGLERLQRSAVRKNTIEEVWGKRPAPDLPDSVGGHIRGLPKSRSLKELEKQAKRFQRISKAYQESVKPKPKQKRSGV